MSISDTIVVMKDGVVQQIGRPQDVYDDPNNLFVAKFLGTPPINVFSGSLRGGRIYIGEEEVFSIDELGADSVAASASDSADSGSDGFRREPGKLAKDAGDTDVWIGIRPEGFYVDEKGPLTCALKGVEVMGRDVTVLSSHPAFDGETIRTIVDSENRPDTGRKEVHFRVRPGKIFVFSKETGERLYGSR